MKWFKKENGELSPCIKLRYEVNMEKQVGYTREEEIANTWSHGLGIVLGTVAGCFLLYTAIRNNTPWGVGCVLAYLFGMLSSYITSTLYHGAAPGKRKALLRKFDHAAIYLHIVGTYVPFTLIVLRNEGAWGWSLFIFTVIATITGVFMSFRNLKEHSHIETICFVLMGGCILVAFKPLWDVLSVEGRIDALYWLIAGGVSYIVGAVFYSLTKMKYMHTVFHIFTLGGTVCHIVAIYKVL